LLIDTSKITILIDFVVIISEKIIQLL